MSDDLYLARVDMYTSVEISEICIKNTKMHRSIYRPCRRFVNKQHMTLEGVGPIAPAHPSLL